MKLTIKNRYWVTPVKVLNDPNLSWKWKWLYGYIQSKPEDWDFAVDRIAEDAKDWSESTATGIRELEALGYLVRRKYQNKQWHWEIEYILYDSPNHENPDLTDEVPDTENPSLGTPTTDKPQTKQNRNSKIDIVNNLINKYNILNNNIYDTIEEYILRFIHYRKKIKNPMTDYAIELFVKKIVRYIDTYWYDTTIECIELSIESWRKTLYEPRKQYKPYEKPQEQDRNNWKF